MSTCTKAVGIGRAELVERLRWVAVAMPAATTLPVLQCVRLEARRGSLHMAGTDLDTWASTTLPVEGGDGWVAVTHGRRLLQLLMARSGDTHVEMAGQGRRLSVEGTGHRYELRCEDPVWPEPEERPWEGSWALTRGDLARIASDVVPFTGVEDHRPILHHVHLRGDDRGGAIATATNGHILARVALTAPVIGSLVVPAGAFSLAASMPGVGPVEMDWSEAHVRFRSCGSEAWVRRTEKRFPGTDHAIPTEHKTEVTLGRQELLEALERAVLIADYYGNGHACRVDVNMEGVQVGSYDADAGEGVERIAGHLAGDAITLGVNGRYLAKALAAIPGERVRLHLGAPERAITIQSADPDPDHLYLVMPMRLTAEVQ